MIPTSVPPAPLSASANDYGQVMWTLDYPALCGPAGCCCHTLCLQKVAQAELPCYVCEKRIEPGEKFFPVTVYNGIVVTQVHALCDRQVRR